MNISDDKKLQVYNYLDDLKIEYSKIDHNELMTMEDCKNEEKGFAHICKNLFLRNQQKTKFYLLMMPSNKRFLTKQLSKQINSARLSFSEPIYLEKYLGCTPGSASVMGLINDYDKNVQLLIDEELLGLEYLGVHPCVNTSTIKIKTKNLLNVFLPNLNYTYNIVKLVDPSCTDVIL